MAEEKLTDTTNLTASSTDLAFQRTALAYERTLMAWVRTSISLTSFGFTIYKFFQEISKDKTERLLSPRIVGMIMIGFGLIALVLAQVQHQIAMRKLREDYPAVQRSLSSVIGVMVFVFGLVLFLGALFRQ